MTEVNFADLLNVQVDTAERPKSFPIGNYQAIIAGHEFGTSSRKGTPFVRFFCKLVGPSEDVDEEIFEEVGGMEALQARKPLRLDFYLTGDAMYRLREFLEDSLELQCAGRSFDEVIPEATNVTFTATIAHDAGQKPGEVYMNISDYAIAA